MTVFASADLSEPVDQVWALVGDFARLRRWHPLIERCDVEGHGIGAVRTVHFADWWAAERLEGLDEQAHTVTYSITDSSRPEVIGVVGSIALTPTADGGTRIDWTSGHQADHPLAAIVNPPLEAYYPVRIGHLRSSLANGA